MKKLKRIFCFSMILIVTLASVHAAMFYKEPLKSESVYVVNTNSGVPVIEKNIHERRSPASLTKIMTFIVAYENVTDLSEKVRVRQEVLDKVDPLSSGVRLKPDEEISVIDLMHCVLICSSGYAANVLADYVGNGDIGNFVQKMNEKACELGCENTHFTNPDGMYDENQFSTAFDIYSITNYALKISVFGNITSKCEYSCFGDERDPIVTTNRTMDPKRGGEYYCRYVKGIKTGFLKEAGRCLVSRAENDGVEYIAVVMGGPTQTADGAPVEGNMAMLDTKNIYSWIYENLHMVKLYMRDFPLTEIGLDYVWGTDKLLLRPQDDVSIIVPKNVNKEDVSLEFHLPKSVEPTVNEGDVIGSADIFYSGEKLGSFNLVCSKTYTKAQNWFVKPLCIFGKIISHPVFLFFFLIALFLLVIYILAAIRANKRRMHKLKVKKFPGKRRLK